jgi:hypothetical protein
MLQNIDNGVRGMVDCNFCVLFYVFCCFLMRQILIKAIIERHSCVPMVNAKKASILKDYSGSLVPGSSAYLCQKS